MCQPYPSNTILAMHAKPICSPVPRPAVPPLAQKGAV